MSEADAAALDRQIDERRARLDALRPLDPRSLRVLDDWYDVELTWSSNAVEGNSLTRVETAIVIEKGMAIGGKPLKDHLEAIDHIDALGFVRALAQSGEQIRETDLREIHRLVLGRSAPGEAGRDSAHRRTILGSSLILPSPAQIPPLMADSRLGSPLHPPSQTSRSKRITGSSRSTRSRTATAGPRAC